MLFWKGKGILAIFIPVAVFIVLGLIGSLFGVDFSNSKPLVSIALIASSLSTWFLGRKLNGAKPRILIDQETNEQVLLKENHTFWFINLEYWSVVWAIASLFSLFY